MGSSAGEILERSGLPEPQKLAQECGLLFIMACVVAGRAFGEDLCYTWTGTRRTRAATSRSSLHLQVPKPSVPSFRLLGPFALQELWNQIGLDIPNKESDQDHPLRSAKSFRKSLPSLLSRLTQ